MKLALFTGLMLALCLSASATLLENRKNFISIAQFISKNEPILIAELLEKCPSEVNDCADNVVCSKVDTANAFSLTTIKEQVDDGTYTVEEIISQGDYSIEFIRMLKCFLEDDESQENQEDLVNQIIARCSDELDACYVNTECIEGDIASVGLDDFISSIESGTSVREMLEGKGYTTEFEDLIACYFSEDGFIEDQELSNDDFVNSIIQSCPDEIAACALDEACDEDLDSVSLADLQSQVNGGAEIDVLLGQTAYSNAFTDLVSCIFMPTISDAKPKADNVPAKWTCDASWYNTLDGCNCGCGTRDRDCKKKNQVVVGCVSEDAKCSRKGECIEPVSADDCATFTKKECRKARPVCMYRKSQQPKCQPK